MDVSRGPNTGHRAQHHEAAVSLAERARLPLTPETYRTKFLALIHFEEKEHIRLLAEKCDGQYYINAVTENQLRQFERDRRYYYFCISGMTPQQIMYASQASSDVRIQCSSTVVVRATIVYSHEHYSSGSSVLYIRINSLNDTATAILKRHSSNHTKLMITFQVKHSYFQNLITCVEKISNEAIRRIVPSEKDFKNGLDFERIPRPQLRINQLDHYQFRALQRMVFSRGTAPVLVPAPFGSGKTRLLSVATEYLIRNAKSENKICRILLCCHQQKSADVFMKDYFSKMICHRRNPLGNNVYRIVSHTYGKKFENDCELLVKEFLEKVEFQRFKHLVVVTTFLTALKMVDRRIPQGYFTHILIDEGAQAREPECIAPLCMADSNTRIVIVGDSKQVGPKLLVLGKTAQEYGLAQSLLERLHDSYMEIPEAKKHSVVHLRNNYRCVANILKVPSELFYDSRLIPCSRKTHGVKGFPLQFICSSMSREPLSLCDSDHEANIVVKTVKNILQNMPQITPLQMCILCSSQRQASRIRKIMNSEKLNHIKTLSSYQMQGQEFDVLILSTVESVYSTGRPFDPLKSFAHPAVFNTAITRARSLIVAVGNPFTLKKCECAIQGSSRCWNLFISTCEKNETFLSKQPAASSRVVRNERRTRDDFSILSESTRNKRTPSSYTAEDPRRVHREYPTSNRSSHKLNPLKTQQSAVPKVTGVTPMKNSSEISTNHIENRLLSKIPNSTLRVHSTQSVGQRSLLPNKSSKDHAVLLSNRAPQLSRPPEPVTRPPAVVIPQTSGLVADAFLGHIHRPNIPNLLKEPLTKSNYREKFHHLLCREEEEHARILKERCDGIYEFHIYGCGFFDKRLFRDSKDYHVRFGYITASHLDGDKIAYAVQASEGQLVIKFESVRTVQMKVDIVGWKDNKMFVGLINENNKNMPRGNQLKKISSTVKVNFILKFSYFNRLHDALFALSDEVISKILPEFCDEFSCGHESSDKTKFRINLPSCLKLSKSQMYACNVILDADPSKAPVLIAGSFGTGKTRLIASTAYQILKGSSNTKVLVCAHHQKSVDSFMINYFGKKDVKHELRQSHIVRLVPNTKYRVPKEEYRQYYTAPHEMRCLPKQKIRLVFTTFSSTPYLRESFKDHFTHIFIDEGAQAREPESIMPLCLANKNTSIVIAGDHKQVGPSVLVLGHDAREYGLKISLLERLHDLYSTEKFFKQSSSQHCVSLWTNFRSHHALLCLPSYLFYGSALVTAAKAAYESYPDGQYPLQFVCSSLDDSVCEVKESSNLKEVELILDEVKNCIEKWPERQWGRLNPEEICVMATTANQRDAFRRKLYKKEYECIENIKLLTVYDIQGSEFRAIFLSTAEPIDEQGKSKNPTKSPCGQFVFNTAITRAKSLIVCAGNPFLLMKVEKCMEQVDLKKSFWKNYLRRCLITKSLKIAQEILESKNGREKLQQMLFSEESKSYANQTSEVTKANDSIIKRLEDFVSERHNIKNCKLKIIEQQKESQNWKIDESENLANAPHRRKRNDASISGREISVCLLQIRGPRDVVAIPQQSSRQDSIIINGYGNRIGAFDGDIVRVSVLGSDENGQKYGKVVGVKEFQHPTKYICKADPNNCINFFPIDRRVPSIVNLPKVSRSILERNPKEFGELQKDYISVFEESSLNIDEDLSLRIKELIPFEMAPSVLFVVKIFTWSPKFRKPLGAVVAVLPHTNNLFINEKLLLVAHDIQHNQTVPPIEELIKDKHVVSAEDKHLKTYTNGITIDPSDAINFDDALAIVPGKSADTFELTVFITDVAHYIPKDSKLDDIAKSRGTSVYPGQIKHNSPCTALHMLPPELAKEKLSLCGDNSRRVIAITASVRVTDNDEVIEVKEGTPSEALLKNSINLTYNSSQCIMNGTIAAKDEQLVKKFKSSSRLPLNETLTLLFKVAMKIRINRLADAAFNYKLSCDTDERDWQSHLMVEELMIWANRQVAEYMIQESLDTAIVRTQLPPLVKELNDLCENYKQILPFSLCYKSLYSAEELEAISDDQCGGLVLSSQILKTLSSAFRKNDLNGIVRILSREMNFSQLAMIEGAVNSISRSAQYACAKSLTARDSEHFSLKCRYTHFSSPIRRYFDIVVQRIVKALIGKKDMPYTSPELQKLCQLLDLKIKNSNRYCKDIDRALIASELEDEGMEEVTAYVACSLQKKHKLHLCFPSSHFGDFMNRDDTSFDVSELNYHKPEEKVISWEVVVVPLSSNPPLSLAHLCNPGEALPNVKFFPKINKESDERHLETCSIKFKETSKLVDLETWRLAQQFVKNQTRENLNKFMDKLNYQSEQATAPPLPDQINESPLIQYTVKKEFGECSPVKVWISKSLRNPISSPGLSLIEVAPTVRVCLQHMQNPAMCFSNTNLMSSRSQYKSVDEYVDLWSKALLAEACHDGVNTRKVIILKDASLNWPKLVRRDTSIDEICFKPKGDLSLTICLDKYDMMDLLSIRSGDLVCARYEIRDSEGKVRREIYHFCVSKAQMVVDENQKEKMKYAKKDELTILLCSYSKYGCKVSEKMQKLLKSNPPCELQVMKIPVSYNRVFEKLQILKETWKEAMHSETSSKFTLDLALGLNYYHLYRASPEKMNVYQEVYQNDSFAKCLWEKNTTHKQLQLQLQLNKSQLDAIKRALKHRFQLIQGPPGTGKSVTGAHLAYIFAKSNRKTQRGQCVLYCGPSNKAVDVVHDQLLKLNNLLVDEKQKIKIIRLYGRTHERKDPVLEALHMDINENTEGMCADKYKQDALHFKIREEHIELKELEQKIRTAVQNDNIPSLATRKRHRTLLRELEAEELQNQLYDIILCTCNETCSKRILQASLNKKQNSPRIAQCIVDECGMATEPETLAAISLAEHAVLIGDHKQLQPVVKYQPARQCGLGRSMFERYADWEVSKNDLVTLDIQYRMHPGICEGPSQLFYQERLKTHTSIEERAPLKKLKKIFGMHQQFPVQFYDVQGEEESELKGGSKDDDSRVHKPNIDAHSKCNIEEARKIVEVVKILMKTCCVKETSIAVLTPYTAQKAKVKELLNGREVKVLSVAESQGDEYDVVILSTVRSQPRDQIEHRDYIQPDLKWKRENLGFLTDPHQLNVAITRAKYGLIIIGDRVLLEYDDNWKKLIEKYEKNGCIINSK